MRTAPTTTVSLAGPNEDIVVALDGSLQQSQLYYNRLDFSNSTGKISSITQDATSLRLNSGVLEGQLRGSKWCYYNEATNERINVGIGYPNSLGITGTISSITTLDNWNTLSSDYIVFIDSTAEGTLPDNRHIYFEPLTLTSGSEYQTVTVQNYCNSSNWFVDSNNNIYGTQNSTLPTTSFIVPHVQQGKPNSITFRSMKYNGVYQWIAY
jgi:hypothetical protein